MSSADRFLASAQRRQHRGVHIALALSVGLTAACAISLIAGATRSASVVERVFEAVPTYDVVIFDESSGLTAQDVASLPGVDRADSTDYIAFNLRGVDPVSGSINANPTDFSLPNPSVRILRGHAPDGTDPFEVVVNQSFADNLSLDVGDPVAVVAFAPDQRDEMASGVYEPRGPEYDFTIAAIVRFPSEIALDEQRSPRTGFTTSENLMIVSDDFFYAHHAEWIGFGSAINVRLNDGQAGLTSFVSAARALMSDPNDLIAFPWTAAENTSAFDVPVDLETSALLAVGVGAALVAALLALLLVRLDRRLLDADYSALRTIGVTTKQLTLTAALRLAPAALAAGAIAMVGAVVLSDRFPIGIGRQLEIERGRQVNVAVVVGGGVGVVVALVVGGSLLARLAGLRTRPSVALRSRRVLGTGRLPLHASIGARLAAGGRDDGRSRSSSVIASLATGVAATAIVIAVSAWLAGTNHLYNSPSARGWQWDVAVGNVNFPLDDATLDAVTNSPLVAAATSIGYGQATLNGLSTEVLAFDPAGDAPPETLRGRLPITPSEIALGAALLRKLDVAIGDSVTLSLADSEFVVPPSVGGELTLTVVGESVSPVFGESDIADIGVVTFQAIADANGNAAPCLVMVDVAGPDVTANLDALLAPLSEEVHSDVVPARVVNLHGVRSLPDLGRSLAGVLGLIAIAATLVTPARTNRKKLAVLSALGLDRKGRRLVASWQGLFTATAVLLMGIPLGLGLGAAWWRDVTADLGVRNTFPWATGAMTVTVVAALLGAIAAALFAVRRVSVASTLRGE
ncbi:MAG: hypothetical protein K8R99_13915 [Actinomycetia bacterium]|nr:hypothetical protein [Actinomycetes bacterium]